MNLIIINHLGLGGAEKIVSDIIKSHKNPNIIILCIFNTVQSSNRICELEKHTQVKFIFKRKVQSNSFLIKLYKITTIIFAPIISLLIYLYCLKKQIKLVHINLNYSNYIGIYFNIIRKIFKKPIYVVETFHTNRHLLSGLWRFIMPLNWRMCDLLIYEIGKGEFNGNYHSTPVRFQPFAICNLGSCSRYKTKSGNNTIILSVVCRLKYQIKRFDLILGILNNLQKSGIKLQFYIGGDGEDRKLILDSITSILKPSQLKYYGFVQDPKQIYCSTDFAFAVGVDGQIGVSGLQAIKFGNSLIYLDSEISHDPQSPELTQYCREKAELIQKISNSETFRRNYNREQWNSYKEYLNKEKFHQFYSSLYNKIT